MSVASAEDFLARLERLERDGLPQHEERFFDLLQNQSKNNLLALQRHSAEARKSIGQRLDEVNASLEQVPFNRGTLLTIELSDRRLPEVGEFQLQLREVLSQQGLSGADKVRVVSRAAMADPRVLRRIEAGRMLGGGAPLEDARVILASVPGNDGQWVTARAIDRQPTARGVRGLVTQTLVLFGALMLVMWLLLRRITRPLAQLTGRVEAFARTQDLTGQLEPQGPDDVRQLIEAHNAMEARIAAMLDEKDVMLGAIGHDLKTPLAALRVRIESVDDEGERARMAATIEDITTSLDDILSLARVGRPRGPI